MMQRMMAVILGLSLGVAGASQAATVEQRYASACATCHGSGVGGAPKKGDAVVWAPRLKQGDAVLLAHVKNGFRAMPPRGLCNDCTDTEYKALIDYMSR